MAHFFPPFHLVPSPSRSLIHKTKVKSVVVTMMTMTMEPKEGMMIIMKRNELWQNGFYVDGDDGSAADYHNRDLTKLRWRRQRERQKTIGLMSKTTTLHVHHAFLYIYLSFLHKYDVKWPILRSLENGNGKL